MAKIPNQTNILDAIKSQADNVYSVMEIICSSADKFVAKFSSVNNVITYSKSVQTVFGKDGIMNVLMNIDFTKSFAIKLKLKAHIRTIKNNINHINTLLNYLASLNINVAGALKVIDSLKPVNQVFTAINQLFKTVNDIKNHPLLGVKLLLMRFNIFRLKLFVASLVPLYRLTSLLIGVTIPLQLLNKVFTILNDTFTTIDTTPAGIATLIKLKIIAFIIKRLIVVIRAINTVGRAVLHDLAALKNIVILKSVFQSLKSIFDAVQDTPIRFIGFKLKRITKGLFKLLQVVNIIGVMRVNLKALIKIKILQLIISSIGSMFAALILITPIVILGGVAAVALLIVFNVFKFVFKLLINTLIQMAAGPVVKGMLALVLISGLFTAIAVMFMLLGSIAKDIVKQSLWILAMLGVIIGFVGLMAVLGLVCAAAAIPLLAAIAGILLVTVIAGLLVLLALMLKELEKINLDGDKITENVNLVLGTAKSILENIFKPDDKEDTESDKSWIASILEFIGGAIAPVIKAIMAVAYLALLTVGIACILLIAGMLSLIQELDLDPSKIETNVDIVIDTSLLVVDTIFNGSDKNSKQSNKTFIEKVLDYLGSGLVTVIKAILAVAFLAVIILAISLILLIAAQLRLLQELNLDAGLISKNVTIVIDTAVMVITSIFDRPDRDGQQSNKGFLSAVIDFICPELGMIFDALMAVAFLAVSILSISLVLVLAAQLRLLQEIPLDPALITANVTTVLETCQFVIDSVMGRTDRPDDPSSKGWIRTLFEWLGVGGLLQIIDCIMALAWLGMSVALINMVTMLANQLKTLQDIKLDKNKITKNTEAVCTTADAVSACVLGRKNPIKGNSDGPLGKVLRWLFPALAEAIDMMTKMKWVSGIMSTVGVVKQVADTLMTLLKLPDVSPVKNKVKYVCDTADEIVSMVTSRPAISTWDDAKSRMNWMHRINQTVKEMNRMNPAGIKKSQQALRAHIALVKQINSTDVSKLETSARMFENMARFSESIHGNFKKLAQTLSEDLMPILKDLKEIMGIIPEKLETGFQNTSASIAATTTAPTAENVTAQVNRENPNMDKQQVDNLVQQRLKEYSKNSANGVVAKMDQLIDLLKGYSGEHVQVHTV